MLDERSLAKQFLFWAAIILPVLLFFTFGIPLWEDLNFEFSKEAYNRFLDINKFPLYLFGTCVPLVAIVAYMHRTIQTEKQINHTKKQIELTENKNKADSYYSHVKFFVDAINSFPEIEIEHKSPDNLKVLENLTFNQPYALYKRIFLESNLDNGYSKQRDEKFRTELISCFQNINATLSRAGNNIYDLWVNSLCLCDIDSYIVELCDLLLIEYNPRNHMYWVSNFKSDHTISFQEEHQLKKTLNHLFKTVQRLCDFTGMDSNFLRPHPLNDEEHSLHFYLSTDEVLFRALLTVKAPVKNDKPLGFVLQK